MCIILTLRTDFGLCKQVSQNSNTEKIFGVIPYIDLEVLYTGGKENTEKSDIYSFGIIMSEFFTDVTGDFNKPKLLDIALSNNNASSSSCKVV
ncbi:9111_t:CDS:2 [Cetraspora pellucida]|uniref:9111_t:CDS:1 n=1 Tax=Cetraspora pellucida TaxID=1433469 RepID=A0A9N9CJV5_9GLOM|nr:9111_t:CDS:2 [Cetraspora pellucida]